MDYNYQFTIVSTYGFTVVYEDVVEFNETYEQLSLRSEDGSVTTIPVENIFSVTSKEMSDE